MNVSTWLFVLTVVGTSLSAAASTEIEVTPEEKRFVRISRPHLFSTAARTLSAAGASSEPFKPVPLAIGYPLVQTKGVVKGNGFLYIADTGKDATHNEPAQIWKFDPATKQLTMFYQGPLLTQAKWLFFRSSTRVNASELYVSDYGEELAPRTAGTGKGAKVFAIPIDKKGDALEPRVLHEGPPFRSPEGITVVGDTVVVADWAAGEETELGDRPGRFNRGKVFTLPTAGGVPTEIFADHLWVTLIGACRYFGEDGRAYIRFIDLDSGRPHEVGRMLPQSGTVEFYRTRIVTERPLKLGKLERVVLHENVPVSLPVPAAANANAVRLRLSNDDRFSTNKTTLTLPRIRTRGNKDLTVTVLSDSSKPTVPIVVESLDAAGRVISGETIDIKKRIIPDYSPMADNKHGGRAEVRTIPLVATADGTTKGLYLLPPAGGVPATVWRGAPFSQPMGVQYSFDQGKVWVTDQDAGPDGTAAIFEVSLPTEKERLAMFPSLKQRREIIYPAGYEFVRKPK